MRDVIKTDYSRLKIKNKCDHSNVFFEDQNRALQPGMFLGYLFKKNFRMGNIYISPEQNKSEQAPGNETQRFLVGLNCIFIENKRWDCTDFSPCAETGYCHAVCMKP